MLKKITITSVAVAMAISSNAQKLKKTPEYLLTPSFTETHIRFLASDELLGRRTGDQGNKVAARYIAEQFRSLGIKPVNNGDYFQKVELESVTPPAGATITTQEGVAKIGEDFVLMSGDGLTNSSAEVVYLEYAWIDAEKGYDDYKGVDVKGKIIVTSAGTPDTKSPQQMFSTIGPKQKIAKEKGALAIIEVFNSPVPWRNISNYFGRKGIKLKTAGETSGGPTHLWISSASAKILAKNKISKIDLNIPKKQTEEVNSSNVVGVLEGSDPVLKNEYIVLSAHYDHIGYGAARGNVASGDTIFNGARDNAFGVTAVLTAAESFAKLKPKRSILFIAYTGEELGMLGSKYYSEHPLIPMKNCVFNLNCDGAGYNDMTKITVIGLSRTDAKSEIVEAATAFGLTATDDPAPEQNLFDRSDNVSFAAKGVPSPNYAPGMTAFDDAINKYYHQSADNPESVDFNYLLKYAQSYTYAARLIANRAKAPAWIAGDKYEKAYQTLYGK